MTTSPTKAGRRLAVPGAFPQCRAAAVVAPRTRPSCCHGDRAPFSAFCSEPWTDMYMCPSCLVTSEDHGARDSADAHAHLCTPCARCVCVCGAVRCCAACAVTRPRPSARQETKRCRNLQQALIMECSARLVKSLGYLLLCIPSKYARRSCARARASEPCEKCRSRACARLKINTASLRMPIQCRPTRGPTRRCVHPCVLVCAPVMQGRLGLARAAACSRAALLFGSARASPRLLDSSTPRALRPPQVSRRETRAPSQVLLQAAALSRRAAAVILQLLSITLSQWSNNIWLTPPPSPPAT